MFINNSAKYTLQVMLRALVFQSDGSLGEGNIVYDNMKMAVMVLGMLPVLVIYPFVQKYFVSGLMLGGCKRMMLGSKAFDPSDTEIAPHCVLPQSLKNIRNSLIFL